MFTRKLNSHIAATILFDARESARRDNDRQSEKAYEAGAIKRNIAKLESQIAELDTKTVKTPADQEKLASLKLEQKQLQESFDKIEFKTREDLR